ncbi:hypothetical protein KIH74_08970 [Kineosporia sp. J2-2]|uniref:Anti-sigma factor n=1 Tax=Kineosporia corallincola TaxID=2835133 RepID=A0ABS5TD94_9ACTN|nr:hypothetical protein [Kineosporia corallincola]MBT0769055.1 hypothetical protein [Kineosporia corallincola]
MTEDDLRARLRRADPAVSLEPLSAERVSGLTASVMDAGRTDVSRQRRSLWSGRARPVAGAVLLAAAAAGIFAGVKGNVRDEPAPVVQRVQGGGGATFKCAAPSADGLIGVELAVEGTVRSVSSGVVTLDVSRVWAGSPVGVLEVAQTSGASESLLGADSFEVGGRYLVAVEGGAVRGCGYSGPASSELRALYDEAF